jgi:hypothetical protein
MPVMPMETLLSLLLGVGLSAACGFRVFVPLLAMSVATQAGYFTPAPEFAWVGSLPALIALATATALEIAAYYIPWLDNALDAVATPLAVIAGVVVTSASLDGNLSPMLTWGLAALGGGVAGGIQGATTFTRATSTATTGGLANPVVATIENLAAVGLAVLSIVFPVFAGLVVVLLGWLFARTVATRRRTPTGERQP